MRRKDSEAARGHSRVGAEERVREFPHLRVAAESLGYPKRVFDLAGPPQGP